MDPKLQRLISEFYKLYALVPDVDASDDPIEHLEDLLTFAGQDREALRTISGCLKFLEL